jgi:hypothetical protein
MEWRGSLICALMERATLRRIFAWFSPRAWGEPRSVAFLSGVALTLLEHAKLSIETDGKCSFQETCFTNTTAIHPDAMAVVSDQFFVTHNVPAKANIEEQPRTSLSAQPIGSICVLRQGAKCGRFSVTNPPLVAVADRFDNRVLSGEWVSAYSILPVSQKFESSSVTKSRCFND